MKLIKIDIPLKCFLLNVRENSFYEDVLSNEIIKAQGILLPPIFPDMDKDNIDTHEVNKRVLRNIGV